MLQKIEFLNVTNMSKKHEKWEATKDWSIYEHSWVRLPETDWTNGKDAIRYSYAYIDKVKSADQNTACQCFHMLTEGKAVRINTFFNELQFDINSLTFGLLPDNEPLQFCSEEEALSGLTDAAKKLVKFYLEQE